MDVHEFMGELNIKSQTTFNERAKTPGFPVAVEWPPGSKKRGWIREEANAYLDSLIEQATRWPDVEARPLAGAAKGQQSAQ